MVSLPWLPSFHRDVALVGHLEGVVAEAALHPVVAGVARQRVVAEAADQRVVAAETDEAVGEIVAGDLVGLRALPVPSICRLPQR